ncbi:MAG: cell division ATP-binding protein FtsE [Candidatus Melainabacteria bacterium HGW-Melainabacteria-1]|nr:MAG: cell division ATP-binding protein FtsE [Candidatus Melainabacteria bacterium HGW-Melainabacteria-1]
MIRFVKVSKLYPNGIRALRNISLEIPAGSFTFLVGPSGSGKSTLIKLLFREELASEGEIWVLDKNIENMHRHDVPLLRQRTGVVFQDFKLLQQKTVWENVAFALEILGIAKAEQQKRIQGVLELTNMYHLKDFYPRQLSGGEQQRTSVARAIVNKPPVLLADEPTGNLDPDASWDIMKLLAKIGKTGTTVIISTHNYGIVDRMKRRTIKLDGGQVIADIPEGAWPHGS